MKTRRDIPVGQWPEAMEQGRIADAAFAAAYARVSDRQRAWIKTGLAAVFAAWGGPRPLRRRNEACLGHDLSLTDLETPLDFALFVCGPGFTSPARLVAAVVPALCARVADVAALRLGGPWPRPLLTALELCGVETACRAKTRSLPEILAGLPDKGRGAVVVLGGVRTPSAMPSGVRLFDVAVAGRAGVFADCATTFDHEALAFAHPDMAFSLHSEGAAPQTPFSPGQGDLAEAADLGYDAVYVGTDHLDQGLKAAPLAFGPGRETCWLWPELPPGAFRQRRLAATVDTAGRAR